MLAARARALIAGRLAPSPDDVAALAHPVLIHRMALGFAARSEGISLNQVIDDLVADYIPPKSYADQWDGEGLTVAVKEQLGLDLPVADWAAEEGVDDGDIIERLEEACDKYMAEKTDSFGDETMRRVEKQILLQTIDGKWREHLLTLNHLRSVVGFRGYAQRDPLNEYKTEGFQLFESLLDGLRSDVTKQLARIRPMSKEEQEAMVAQAMQQQQAAVAAAATADSALVGFDESDPTTWGNPSRNDDCPCGSKKKFKHCHGRLA